jgi:hypothetical protein
MGPLGTQMPTISIRELMTINVLIFQFFISFSFFPSGSDLNRVKHLKDAILSLGSTKESKKFGAPDIIILEEVICSVCACINPFASLIHLGLKP